VRYLSAIVEVSALAVLDARQDLAASDGVALELVCHDHPRNISQALQGLAEEPLGRGCVAPALDQNVEDISVLVAITIPLIPPAGNGCADVVRASSLSCSGDFLLRLAVCQPHDIGQSNSRAQSWRNTAIILYRNDWLWPAK
jgi:hypothetical protein